MKLASLALFKSWLDGVYGAFEYCQYCKQVSREEVDMFGIHYEG